MNIPISPTPSILIPPEKPPVEPSPIELGAVQALLNATEEMLGKANDSLIESLRLSKRLKKNPTAAHSSVKPHPNGNGSPTQTELTAQVYSIFCQIDSLYKAFEAGKIPKGILESEIISPGLGLFYTLKTLLSQITDATLKGHINDVMTEVSQGKPYPSHVPDAAAWDSWWKTSKLSTVIGQWLGNNDNNHSMDSELTSPDDQMNMIQIMINLSQQGPIHVDGKTVDALFWANDRDIFQTVAAYSMSQVGNNWAGVKTLLQSLLNTTPPQSADTPNYNQFIQGIQAALAQNSWPYPIPPNAILNDGFAFNNAWCQFRTGTPIVDPNHIKYGS